MVRSGWKCNTWGKAECHHRLLCFWALIPWNILCAAAYVV